MRRQAWGWGSLDLGTHRAQTTIIIHFHEHGCSSNLELFEGVILRVCVQTFSPMNPRNCWARWYALTCIYTPIRFQWIRGLSLKQLKKTHTCTHSWFIFIASHKLTAGHWQSAFVQPAITAWHGASIYGEPAGQDDSGGARAARSPKSRAARPSAPPPPARGDCSLDSEHLCSPWRPGSASPLYPRAALPVPAWLSTVPGQLGLVGPAGCWVPRRGVFTGNFCETRKQGELCPLNTCCKYPVKTFTHKDELCVL